VHGFRLLSSYRLRKWGEGLDCDGGDKSATTLLLPEAVLTGLFEA